MSLNLQGSVIREQGVTFAVVVVKRNVLESSQEANRAIQWLSPYFRQMPVVLMAQDNFGAATYYGRRDIVSFLSRVSLSCIPWKQYRFS